MKKYIFLVLMFGSILGCYYLAEGPNMDLSFSRQIPSGLSPERLDRNIRSITRWPQWFHSVEKVTYLDSFKRMTQNQGTFSDASSFHKGSLLQLEINPHRGKNRKFDLTVQVLDYVPSKTLTLRLVDDSSKRLTRIFDRLDWEIQIFPDPKGSRIVGTAIAHTRTWKSRFFGRIAKQILMNQVYYPDLVKLAEMRQPFSADLDPQTLGINGPDQ